MLGILPLASMVFLAYITIKNILEAPAAQNIRSWASPWWNYPDLRGQVRLKSPFFAIKRESWSPDRPEG